MELNLLSDKRKIIIVTAGFFPQNSPRSFRATELAKEFARRGHEVVVYTPVNGFDYRNLEDTYGFTVKDLGRVRFKNFTIASNGSSQLFKRAINRVLQLLIEYPDIQLMFKVRRALRGEKDFDLLISNAVPYPVHWGVALFWVRNNSIAKTWVADCGDPYMGLKWDSFRKLFYFKYIEKWFCRKADYISVPADDYVQYYYPEFKFKIKVIPQGFKFEDNIIYREEIKNRVPNFAFSGRFLPRLRDPIPFLNYLSTLERDFRFVVFSPNTEFLIPFKEKLGERLVVKGFIQREKLIYELSKMDFLVNIEFHSSIRSNSPSKLADYAIAKRPVISLNMQNLNKESILEFLDGNYEKQMIIRNPDRYRIENVTRQFLELIKD
ncbi:MAG TPA: glycosyltransferase [Candidatus Cloacimonadota bacterium]|nr:glycosyltransferase [Candidatus Cloacimonadota bacterium]